MRESIPTARATSSTSAPDASQIADTALMEETRCARNELATSLLSSEDHTLVVRMRSRGTQRAYTSASFLAAARPSSSVVPPISTRSGAVRSSIAVPSARNSGFESTLKVVLPAACSTAEIASAVLIGTVDFSTTIFGVSATDAMRLAASSQNVRSAARPAPSPTFFVGVFTATKIMSASRMPSSTLSEKNRFFPRAALTTSSRPGS
mmetsp:Transcript_6491/g.17370  ORF Transcript_6491/g.17370 Transcript_6491/m.17370 type:complete len:207 (-) Transcript_6491:241-861(-)